MSDDQDLRGVVTGASSGIGAACACALRARGERVVLVVNGAGLGHTAPFVQQRAEVIRTMLDVNEDDARGRAPGLALGARPAPRPRGGKAVQAERCVLI